MATPAKRLFRPPSEPTSRPGWSTSRPIYRPRQPTATPLYPIVQHHLETSCNARRMAEVAAHLTDPPVVSAILLHLESGPPRNVCCVG